MAIRVGDNSQTPALPVSESEASQPAALYANAKDPIGLPVDLDNANLQHFLDVYEQGQTIDRAVQFLEGVKFRQVQHAVDAVEANNLQRCFDQFEDLEVGNIAERGLQFLQRIQFRQVQHAVDGFEAIEAKKLQHGLEAFAAHEAEKLQHAVDRYESIQIKKIAHAIEEITGQKSTGIDINDPRVQQCI
jgi:hypothetical protein